ncbi:ATP-binding SpoIIE family protein phosphatase [Streptomyces sp. NPDC047014]|uniref:ATP-binding SpoIIE family protein phosphatase n=1 Tax=Streptomyces sp. NPDC047014 TaxID=3155736 RepID=UPI0033C1CC6B
MGGSPLLDCEDSAWFRDQYEAARGAAAALGRRIGLGEHRTAQLVLAVTELTTNLAKHTADGSLLLRVLRNRSVAGVEVIVIDAGPGMPDVPAALRDGVSTVGTLGLGLGAVRRLADRFDVHSVPGTGTVQLARFWPHPLPPSVAGEPLVGGITRPIGGQEICGDAWAARGDHGAAEASRTVRAGGESTSRTVFDWSAMTADRPGGASSRTQLARPDPGRAADRGPAPAERAAAAPAAVGLSGPLRDADVEPGRGVLVMSCDGLGHGPMAAAASQAAVHAFRTGTGHTPAQVMEEVHRALRGTRGAAVAVARLEPGGRLLFCGIGNITASVVTADKRSSLVSHPGIVGHQMRQLRTYEHRLPEGGVLAMHSDGLSDRWKPGDLASFLHHPPALIAAGLLRQAGTRRDDASVVITKGVR